MLVRDRCDAHSKRLPQRMVVGGIFAVGAFVVAAFVQLAINVRTCATCLLLS